MSPLSLNNPRVQQLRRLFGRRSARSDDGVLVLEGPKTLGEALAAGAAVHVVYLDELAGWFPEVGEAEQRGVPVVRLAAGVLAKVADTVTPQAVCAVVGWPERSLEDVSDATVAGGFVIVGVELRDPGNVGTILRSAEAAGAAGVVLCGDSVDVTNPKVVRSSAGALFHLPVVTGVSVDDVFAWAGSLGVRTWATAVRPGESIPFDDANLGGPTAILFGNEAQGLPGTVMDRVDSLLTIPMAGRTESLNVSMSATVVAFEAARQRRILSPG